MSDLYSRLAKIELIQGPTPLHPLPRLSEELGIDLWIKRDDLTGFAMGGNKGRKLEFQIAEALESGAEAIVTCGALQSNFIRQLGAACSMYGLKCGAAVMAMPFEYERPQQTGLNPQSGNVLLDEILGVDLHRYPDDTWDVLYEHFNALKASYEAQGLRTYAIPIGGSSARGAYAFLQAGLELQVQTEDLFEWIVFASSSGSTQTGLCHAFRGTDTHILGIACDPEPEIVHDFETLSRSLSDLMGTNFMVRAEEFLMNFDYVGPGYGVPSDAGREAIELLARKEGIFLDPIYTGKAFAGLLDLVNKGEIGGSICFWHTGGLPALFA